MNIIRTLVKETLSIPTNIAKGAKDAAEDFGDFLEGKDDKK